MTGSSPSRRRRRAGRRHHERLQVEFIFDLASPPAYLAYPQLPTVAERTGASILWCPVLLGGLLKAMGNPSPLTVLTQRAYHLIDMERWARRYGVPLRWPATFPLPDPLRLMRAAITARQEGVLQAFVRFAFEAIWADGRDLGDVGELFAVADSAGLEPSHLALRLSDPEVKKSLREETEAAAARGAFGVPTFFVGGEMFFGQDRLDFVAEALTAAHAQRRGADRSGREG